MTLVQTVDRIDYPESDGKPMGETDLHIDWMIRIRDILKYRYRGQQVYVASNLLVYYQKGDPKKFVVPDVFVVKDSDPGFRRTYKTWEEGKAPNVVFEVTSRSSRNDDQVAKPVVYAGLGVKEFFLYDPTAEYLDPPLQGFRLAGDQYEPMQADQAGALHCDQLGMTVCLESGKLTFYEASTSERLPTEAEAAEAIRQAAETRAAELQAEVERLRAELKRKSNDI